MLYFEDLTPVSWYERKTWGEGPGWWYFILDGGVDLTELEGAMCWKDMHPNHACTLRKNHSGECVSWTKEKFITNPHVLDWETKVEHLLNPL